MLLSFVLLKKKQGLSDKLYVRPKVNSEQLEKRRYRAIKLLEDGCSVCNVVTMVGATPSSVTRWKQAYQDKGKEGLNAKPHLGRPVKLQQKQREKLSKILLDSPRTHGFSTDLWTVQRVAELINNRFGIKYHPGHVWRILLMMGFRFQRLRQPVSPGKEAIGQWHKPRL